MAMPAAALGYVLARQGIIAGQAGHCQRAVDQMCGPNQSNL